MTGREPGYLSYIRCEVWVQSVPHTLGQTQIGWRSFERTRSVDYYLHAQLLRLTNQLATSTTISRARYNDEART